MAFDTTILKVQLDEGISHLTYYKTAVNCAAEELVRMVSDAIPNHFNREMRVAFAQEVFLQAATKVQEEL